MATRPSAEAEYRRMTETPVARLVLTLGIPTTISMLITNVYNMADSYFVSSISLSAGGAIGVVFGLMSILQAVGFMFGHGAGSHISRMLGGRQTDRAHRYASTGFAWALGSGLLMGVLGLCLLTPLMRLLGSTDTILPYARTYAFYILLAAPAMTAGCVLNNILRYEGKATLAMIGLTSGGLLNIALDPLFIFGLDMGIAGAGLATALSQYVSFGILLSVFLLGKTQSRLSLRYVDRDWRILGDVVITGLPSLVRQGLNSVTTMALNAAAKPFGDAAIAAMSYVARTSGLIFCVGLGIGQGFQPVCAFNYGAKRYSRVKKATLFTIAFGAAFIGLIAAGCYTFAPQIIGLFRSEAEVIDIGSNALRIQCAALVFLPMSVVATMLFQSIGKSGPALVLSCLQNGVFSIPLLTILPVFLDVMGIAMAQPLAYVATALVSTPILIAFLRRLPLDGE